MSPCGTQNAPRRAGQPHRVTPAARGSPIGHRHSPRPTVSIVRLPAAGGAIEAGEAAPAATGRVGSTSGPAARLAGGLGSDLGGLSGRGPRAMAGSRAPHSPSRCSFPRTALRLTSSPSAWAMKAAVRPSRQRASRRFVRSSVQAVIGRSPSSSPIGSPPAALPPPRGPETDKRPGARSAPGLPCPRSLRLRTGCRRSHHSRQRLRRPRRAGPPPPCGSSAGCRTQ